jgi:hypothetical protein
MATRAANLLFYYMDHSILSFRGRTSPVRAPHLNWVGNGKCPVKDLVGYFYHKTRVI